MLNGSIHHLPPAVRGTTRASLPHDEVRQRADWSLVFSEKECLQLQGAGTCRNGWRPYVRFRWKIGSPPYRTAAAARNARVYSLVGGRAFRFHARYPSGSV